MSIEQLRSKAKQALLDGKYQKALPFFEELHRTNPKDLRTYVKCAELREKTGDSSGAIKAYIEIAKAYAEQGFVVQAIAINKIILRLSPGHIEVKEHLKELSTERGDSWALTTIHPHDYVQVSDFGMDDSTKLNLERTPLLSELSGDDFESFMDSLSLRHFSLGESIFDEGVAGDYLYLIGMGAVRLEMLLESGECCVLSHLGEGDFFGEWAFMSRGSHKDKAIAESDVSILMVDRGTFDEWVKKHPNMQAIVESFYRQRVLDRILALTPIFKGVPDDARIALADKFQLHSFSKGDEVVREGEAGQSCFLIRSGCVKILTTDMQDGGKQVTLGVMGENSFFGEVALLTDKPRTATVLAQEDLEVMELSRQDFNEITAQYPTVRQVVELYQKKRVQDTIKTLMQRD
ncbi:MAG: cyclic nucleotide-binding domain-containing protein [Mariprofundaceae bacterium]